MEITFIKSDDNLAAICDELSAARWGADNDMATYHPQSLRQFLSSDKNILVIGKMKDEIVCAALCYVLDHPDKSRTSLYIDELDTHPNHRRKGYASNMVVWLRDYAAKNGLNEVWLATESKDNESANNFYESLEPAETVQSTVYTYSKKELC